MTLIVMEGFENVADSGTTIPATQLGNWSAGSLVLNTTNGRLGSIGACVSVNIVVIMHPPLSEIIAGTAINVPDTNASGANYYIFYLVGDGGAIGHLALTVNVAGALQVRRGDGAGTVLATSVAGLVQNGVWGYAELRATIADAGGKAIVHWNGVEVINFVGDTKNGGTGTTIDATDIRGGFAYKYDDLYIIDPTTGSAPTNDFLGDIRIDAIFPNGNGSFSQGTGSDTNSVDNYALVDEARAASTADYVDLSTGEKDTYAYQDLSLSVTSTIYAVQAVTHVQKTDTGNIMASDVARLGGNESVGTGIIPGTSVGLQRTTWTTKPGGGAWTVTDINNAEFGVSAT